MKDDQEVIDYHQNVNKLSNDIRENSNQQVSPSFISFLIIST